MSSRTIALLITIAATGTLQAQAKDVITDAAKYTVQVSTSTEFAFGRELKGTSRGAGLLIDRDRGWILTNAHVAKKSPSRVRVSFRDYPYIPAEKVYTDNHLDLAVLRVDPGKIPPGALVAELGCGGQPKPGTAVIAYGHPWGLAYTATRGIISGTKILSGVENLQTDAAINPGNSGGPLIDEEAGKILGINSSGLKNSEGLNFAVPIQLVCTITDLLRANRDPAPPVIPVKLAMTLGDRDLVVAVVDEAWAPKLQIGDRIMAIDNDASARNPSRFLDRLRGKESAVLRVQRGMETVEFTLEVSGALDHARRLGISFSGILISKSTLPEIDPKLMIVHQIDRASEGEQARINEDDVIMAVDGVRTQSHEGLLGALAGKEGKEIELMIRRHRGKEAYFQFDYFVRHVDVDKVLVIDRSRMP